MRRASMSFSVMRWVRIGPAGATCRRTTAAGAKGMGEPDPRSAWWRGGSCRPGGTETRRRLAGAGDAVALVLPPVALEVWRRVLVNRGPAARVATRAIRG